MHILIIGGGGMIGAKTAARLAREGKLGGKAISRMTLHDVVPPAKPAGAPFPVDCVTGDLSEPGEAEKLVASRPEVIMHLAAIVSGEAEQDFEKGYRINLDGTRYLLEAVRKGGFKPRIVFTSSIAVFGAPFPDMIGDDYHLTPLTSYGTQKAMCELLVSDYTRKGFLDGVSLRLPTIVVRPGKPNKAASGFFSGIIREPLAGQEAVLPVSPDVRHWAASPRAAAGFLIHAASMDTGKIGAARGISLPGLSVTVAEMIESLKRVAGPKVAARIRPARDPFIETIVAGWPRNFSPKRALALGFKADESFDAIIRAHIEDELGGRIA